jgi:hypothetical protein
VASRRSVCPISKLVEDDDRSGGDGIRAAHGAGDDGLRIMLAVIGGLMLAHGIFGQPEDVSGR